MTVAALKRRAVPCVRLFRNWPDRQAGDAPRLPIDWGGKLRLVGSRRPAARGTLGKLRCKLGRNSGIPQSAGPITPRHTDDPDNFRSVERLEQHIVAAKVEHLGPQVLVRMLLDDQQQRSMSHPLSLLENVFPIPVWKIAFTNNY